MHLLLHSLRGQSGLIGERDSEANDEGKRITSITINYKTNLEGASGVKSFVGGEHVRCEEDETSVTIQHRARQL